MGKNKKKSKGKLLGKLFLLAIIVIPCAFILIMIWPINSTYSVAVNTELIEFETLDDNISKIPLDSVEMTEGFFGVIPAEELFKGTFKLAVGSLVKVERVAKSDYAYILIEGPTDKETGVQGSAGTLYDEEDEVLREAKSFIEFGIPNLNDRIAVGKTIIIPVTGHVKIGRAVNYEVFDNSTAILRKGKVTVIGKSILGGDNFKSNSYDLGVGDQFEIEDKYGSSRSKAYGFVSINENPGMTASYKVIGEKGKIITPGPIDNNSGYYISTSLMSRFLNDPVITGISLALGLIVLIAEIAPFVRELYSKCI